MLQILLWCPLALLVLAGIAVAAFPRRWAGPTIYGGSLAVCLAGAGVALTFLLSAGPAQSAWLPLGLPRAGR